MKVKQRFYVLCLSVTKTSTDHQLNLHPSTTCQVCVIGCQVCGMGCRVCGIGCQECGTGYLTSL